MSKPSDKKIAESDNINRLMGLGVSSKTKSYYPDLIKRLDELRQEKEKYQSIFVNAQDGIFRAAPNGYIMDMNPAMKNICCRGEHCSNEQEKYHIHRFFKDKFLWIKLITALKAGEKVNGYDILLEHQGAKDSWISLNLTLQHTPGDSYIIEGIAKDITENKKASEELQKTKSYLNSIINSMPSILIGIDSKGYITSLNSQAELMAKTRIEKAIGCPAASLFPKYARFFHQLLNSHSKRVTTEKYTIHNETGDTTTAITAFPLVTESEVERVIRIDDITEQEEQEAQLVQAKKMQMVGELAGGIAHDFNNLLTGSLGAASIVKMMLANGKLTDNILLKNLDILENASKRASKLVDQLLTLSRKKTTKFQSFNIQKTLTQALDLYKSSKDKSIDLLVTSPQQEAWVTGDSPQIEQVLLNVLVNAEHSMTIMREKKDKWGGHLTLSLNRYFDEKSNVKYWQISVADTGIGICKNNLEKIFSPFYTTKEQGKGTGLGLSMAYSIVNEHNGDLIYNSNPGEGTTVLLRLPEQTNPKSQKRPQERIDILSGEGFVLVVDDEELIRTMLEEILKANGYTPLVATGGEEGTELFKKYHHKLQAVMLDMAMPKISGNEVYKKFLEITPHLPPVILMSGNPSDIRVNNFLKKYRTRFLKKPFSFSQISRILNKATTNNT